jgi:hypothetical protein
MVQREAHDLVLGKLGDNWNLINAELQSAGFQTLDASIKGATENVVRTYDALSTLQNEGPAGFMRAMQEDEQKKLENAYVELETAKQGSEQIIEAIQNAQRQLDINEPRLMSIIAAADENIKRTTEDAALSDLSKHHENIVARESCIAQQLEKLNANLYLLHKDFKEGVKDLKDVLGRSEIGRSRLQRLLLRLRWATQRRESR